PVRVMSEFVARINSWFDQTIDRVSQRFTHYTHWVSLGAAVVVVLTVQLDMIAVVDRLWIDDQFRKAIVDSAAQQYVTKTANDAIDVKPYYDLLDRSSLITLPLDRN